MEGKYQVMRKHILAIASTCLAWILTQGTPALADPLYNITNLDLSPANGVSMNNEGQLVGYIGPGPNWQQGYGFVYNGAPGGNGGVTPLGGSTAATNYPEIRNSQPVLISDSGQIVGAYQIASGIDPGKYYLDANGQVTALPMAPAGFNNAGQVMAMSFQGTSNFGTVWPVVYNLSTGTQESIPAVPGAFQTLPVAINGSGQVAGNTFYQSSYNPDYPGAQGSGFLYSNGTTTPLGTLGGTWTTVNAINANGEVVGSSAVNSSGSIAHAFLYANGHMTDLGTLPGGQNSIAMSINAQGQIVGSEVGGNGSFSAGFLYSNGVMTNLNSLVAPNSGWTIIAGEEINNLGQILALGYNSSLVNIDGSGQGYVLLTPSDLPAPGEPIYPTIVPEPGSLAICGLMAAVLAIRLRWRRRPVPA